MEFLFDIGAAALGAALGCALMLWIMKPILITKTQVDTGEQGATPRIDRKDMQNHHRQGRVVIRSESEIYRSEQRRKGDL